MDNWMVVLRFLPMLCAMDAQGLSGGYFDIAPSDCKIRVSGRIGLGNDINGEYASVGTHSNHPLYQKDGSTSHLLFNNGFLWAIGDDVNSGSFQAFCLYGDADSPDQIPHNITWFVFTDNDAEEDPNVQADCIPNHEFPTDCDIRVSGRIGISDEINGNYYRSISGKGYRPVYHKDQTEMYISYEQSISSWVISRDVDDFEYLAIAQTFSVSPDLMNEQIWEIFDGEELIVDPEVGSQCVDLVPPTRCSIRISGRLGQNNAINGVYHPFGTFSFVPYFAKELDPTHNVYFYDNKWFIGRELGNTSWYAYVTSFQSSPDLLRGEIWTVCTEPERNLCHDFFDVAEPDPAMRVDCEDFDDPGRPTNCLIRISGREGFGARINGDYSERGVTSLRPYYIKEGDTQLYMFFLDDRWIIGPELNEVDAYAYAFSFAASPDSVETGSWEIVIDGPNPDGDTVQDPRTSVLCFVPVAETGCDVTFSSENPMIRGNYIRRGYTQGGRPYYQNPSHSVYFDSITNEWVLSDVIGVGNTSVAVASGLFYSSPDQIPAGGWMVKDENGNWVADRTIVADCLEPEVSGCSPRGSMRGTSPSILGYNPYFVTLVQPEQCCDLCSSVSTCESFSWETRTGNCFLHADRTLETDTSGLWMAGLRPVALAATLAVGISLILIWCLTWGLIIKFTEWTQDWGSLQTGFHASVEHIKHFGFLIWNIAQMLYICILLLDTARGFSAGVPGSVLGGIFFLEFPGTAIQVAQYWLTAAWCLCLILRLLYSNLKQKDELMVIERTILDVSFGPLAPVIMKELLVGLSCNYRTFNLESGLTCWRSVHFVYVGVSFFFLISYICTAIHYRIALPKFMQMEALRSDMFFDLTLFQFKFVMAVALIWANGDTKYFPGTTVNHAGILGIALSLYSLGLTAFCLIRNASDNFSLNVARTSTYFIYFWVLLIVSCNVFIGPDVFSDVALMVILFTGAGIFGIGGIVYATCLRERCPKPPGLGPIDGSSIPAGGGGVFKRGRSRSKGRRFRFLVNRD